MSNIAMKALEEHLESGDEDEDAEEPDNSGEAEASPFREAIREAFDASKSGDTDAFAEAFEAAIEIKLSER